MEKKVKVTERCSVCGKPVEIKSNVLGTEHTIKVKCDCESENNG